jgi:hypothetical protein
LIKKDDVEIVVPGERIGTGVNFGTFLVDGARS